MLSVLTRIQKVKFFLTQMENPDPEMNANLTGKNTIIKDVFRLFLSRSLSG
jgi:hypothetical protein